MSLTELDAILSDLPTQLYQMVSPMVGMGYSRIPVQDQPAFLDAVGRGVAAVNAGDAAGLVRIAEAMGVTDPYLSQLRSLAEMALSGGPAGAA